MKLLKGSLITFLLLVIFSIFGYSVYENKVLNELQNLNDDVNQKWNSYANLLKERNSYLFKENFQNDSLKYYLKKSRSINATAYSKELEYNEYKVNKFTIIDSALTETNNSLNSSINKYNEAARIYNFYKIRFPNFLIAKKTKFNKRLRYFEIQYGVSNEEIMIKKKKREGWIKNGGDFPE